MDKNKKKADYKATKHLLWPIMSAMFHCAHGYIIKNNQFYLKLNKTEQQVDEKCYKK